MANLEIGPRLEELGRLIAKDVGVDPDGTLLYAEVGDRWVEASIFKDIGNVVVFRIPSRETDMLLIDLNDAEDEDKRWSTIQYEIKDGRFLVKFGYEDVETVPDAEAGRRAAFLRERFGDKPVDYSDPDGLKSRA